MNYKAYKRYRKYNWKICSDIKLVYTYNFKCVYVSNKLGRNVISFQVILTGLVAENWEIAITWPIKLTCPFSVLCFTSRHTLGDKVIYEITIRVLRLNFITQLLYLTFISTIHFIYLPLCQYIYKKCSSNAAIISHRAKCFTPAEIT